IGNLEHKTPLIVRGADGDSTILLSKFHGIVDQIPKNLLKAYGVCPDVVAFGAEVHDQIQLFFEDVVAGDFEAVTKKTVDIDDLEMQFDFSASDTGEVQQIID